MEIQDKIISLENEMECFNRYFEANSRCILSAPFGEGVDSNAKFPHENN